MRLQSKAELGRLWLISAAIFTASVTFVRALGRSTEVRLTSLLIGYAGLLAIGVALFRTQRWLSASGPRSSLLRYTLQGLLGLTMVLWLVAMVFPFL
jgi:hypothetical protein